MSTLDTWETVLSGHENLARRQAGWNCSCQDLELGGEGPQMPAGLVLGRRVSSSPMSLPELGFQGPGSQALAVSALQMRKGAERPSDPPGLCARKWSHYCRTQFKQPSESEAAS